VQFAKKTEELTKASEDGSGVKANKAKAELAQHLGTDNLPLRKAKITTEAATKKVTLIQYLYFSFICSLFLFVAIFLFAIVFYVFFYLFF